MSFNPHQDILQRDEHEKVEGLKGFSVTVSETLRQAIRDSGLSLYRIAKDSGVAYSAVHGFYNGTKNVGPPILDKLAEYLELELKPKRKGR